MATARQEFSLESNNSTERAMKGASAESVPFITDDDNSPGAGRDSSEEPSSTDDDGGPAYAVEPASASSTPKSTGRSNNDDDIPAGSGVTSATTETTEAGGGASGGDLGKGFRMHVHPLRRGIRKRKLHGARGGATDSSSGGRDSGGKSTAVPTTSMSLSDSSSSSGSDNDDDEEVGIGDDLESSSVATERASNVTFSKRRRAQHELEVQEYEDENIYNSNEASKHQERASYESPDRGATTQPQHQPEGWRVKLYRLNGDGSWDDCGTGRILCLYKPQPKGAAAIDASGAATTTGSHACQNASSSNLSSGDAWVYHELGEPTLCMHSEVGAGVGGTSPGAGSNAALNSHVTGANSSPPSPPAPRILLRTRILLRDTYQRQGDNIITWCEPYLEEGNPAQGVDLALSFQDNAGCLDIWRQITNVQSQANELFRSQRSSGSGGGPNGDGSNNDVSAAAGVSGAGGSVAGVAHAVAAAHHSNLQRQDQQEMWVNVASEAAAQLHIGHQQLQQQNGKDDNSSHASIVNGANHDEFGNNDQFDDAIGGLIYHHHHQRHPHESGGGGPNGSLCSTPMSSATQLPNPPSLANLEEIADTIAAVQHIQQRDNLAMYISQNECSYLKSLLSLFPSAEAKGDYGSLATLAACVKTILLMNDPSIIELVVTDESSFEEVCATLEYDPDLRDKANHRWFLRERAKFRTVAPMEDEELIAAIHRSFRVNYLRDTLLRPTMDESSLSTLSSLQTFTHADVVKGVTMSPAGTDDDGELLKDSYLAKVIRILGRELNAVCEMEWRDLEKLPPGSSIHSLLARRQQESAEISSTVVASARYPKSQATSTIWKQHLAPQDDSLASRRVRRRGSLAFLRELFNMVRISLQPNDKDDFFAVLVSMEVDLVYDQDCDSLESRAIATTERGKETSHTDVIAKRESSLRFPSKPVSLLSILATVLSDPETDVTEKGSVLEIIAGIAMHDPSLIRRKCLEFYVAWKKGRRSGDMYTDRTGPTRPKPNEKRQIIFHCPENDLLAAFLFLLATETDVGVLLQVSEILRIILDTDMMGDHGPINTGFADEAEGIPPSAGHNPPHDQHPNPTGSGNPTSTELNKFLSMFYEHYIQWLAAPFHFTILHPLIRFPRAYLAGEKSSPLIERMQERFEKGAWNEEPILHKVSFCALRNSFAVELLSFCVRAHVYRMKVYLLRSRVLGNVLKLLKPSALPRITSGDRCLKLAALRFLRAILSVNELMYHKHIIQNDLFGPVFEAFRANPVGDNLVASSIVEMCDFITTEHINSLIEYIVTKHIVATNAEATVPSLEDFSIPYVNTLTLLREAHEKNMEEKNSVGRHQAHDQPPDSGSGFGDEAHSRYFHTNPPGRPRVVMGEKALQDQRKFREVDQEESYFESDDDDGVEPNTVSPRGDDEVDAEQEVEKELHRTPRMFSLAQAPLLNSKMLRVDASTASEIPDDGESKTHSKDE